MQMIASEGTGECGDSRAQSGALVASGHDGRQHTVVHWRVGLVHGGLAAPEAVDAQQHRVDGGAGLHLSSCGKDAKPCRLGRLAPTINRLCQAHGPVCYLIT